MTPRWLSRRASGRLRVGGVVILQIGHDAIRMATDDRKLLPVADGAVERHVVHLIGSRSLTNLHHQNLYLQRLRIARKDRADEIGVSLGQRFGGHVTAAGGIAGNIGVADADFTAVLEFAVLPTPAKAMRS